MNTNPQVMGTNVVANQPAAKPAKSKGMLYRMAGWGLMIGLPILGAVIGTALMPGAGTAGGAGLGGMLAGMMGGKMLGLAVGGSVGYMANMYCQNKANMEDAIVLKERLMPQLNQFQNLPYPTAYNNYQQVQSLQNTGQQIAQYPQGQAQATSSVSPQQSQGLTYSNMNPFLMPQTQMAQMLQNQANQQAVDPTMGTGAMGMGGNSQMTSLWLMQQARTQNAMMALGIANNIVAGIMGNSMNEMAIYGLRNSMMGR